MYHVLVDSTVDDKCKFTRLESYEVLFSKFPKTTVLLTIGYIVLLPIVNKKQPTSSKPASTEFLEINKIFIFANICQQKLHTTIMEKKSKMKHKKARVTRKAQTFISLANQIPN